MEIKNLGQLISHLAAKAGVEATDPNLISLLSNSETTKIPIHSDLVKSLDESLLSIDTAKNNHPLISSVYKAQALGTIDKKLETVIDEMEVDDAEKARLKNIKSTYERQEAVLAKLKEIKPAAAGDDKNKNNALSKQVEDLAKKLQDADKAKTDAVSEVEAARKSDKVGFELFKKLFPKKTIYDQLDPSVKEASINAIINKALQDNDAEFGYDQKGAFTILKKDGTAFLSANHTGYTPDSFLDEILAKNKILVVSNGQQQQQQNGQQQQQQHQHVDAGSGQQQQVNGTNQSVADFNESQLSAAASN